MWRLVLYLCFVGLAAPIDSILALWTGTFGPYREQFYRPLAEALVYIYAFIISVETLFRISQNHKMVVSKPWLRILQLVAGAVVFLFLIDYVGTLRPLLLNGQSVIDAAWRQYIVVFLAFTASALSYAACEIGREPEIKVHTGPAPPTGPKLRP
jgi:hypothetical protein